MKVIEKLDRLKDIISDYKSLVIAYSGGVDSTFLLKVSLDTLGKPNVLAVTADSPTFSKREIKEAKKYAKLIGVKHEIIHTNELESESFRNNPSDRCYYCKIELFNRLKKIASQKGYEVVADGSTLDDSFGHRPGMKVAEELKIVRPLYESKLRKEEIRILSKKLELPTWNKSSIACLASRFPYGKRITKRALSRVNAGETYLRSLGFGQVRVRYLDNTARIEVDKEHLNKVLDFKEDIITKLKQLGFIYVSLDLQGYREGSMDEALNEDKQS